MKNPKSCLALLALVVVLFHAPCALSSTTQLNYQGKLYDGNGTPIAELTVDLTFRIYQTEVLGDALWEETQQVKVRDGVYNVLLGSVTPLAETLLLDTPCWIEAAVGDKALGPRQKVVLAPSNPSGATAGTADTLRASGNESPGYTKQEVDATIASIQAILLAQQAHISNLQDLNLTQQGQIAALLKLVESQQAQITAQAGEITGLYGLAAGLQDQQAPKQFKNDQLNPRWAMHRAQ